MASVKPPSEPARATRRKHYGAALEQLAELQRARILDAMVDVAVQQGAGSVTVTEVVRRSGISRRTFYEHFDDREDCLAASFERALTLVSQRVIPTYESEEGWQERIRAGLVAFLAFCEEHPRSARMLVCESKASGGRVYQRRADILTCLTGLVDQGRNLAGAGKAGKAADVSPLVAEATVCGVLAVIQARLTLTEASDTQGAHTRRADGEKSLIPLTNELMSMIVLPYLGSAAARRELKRSTPTPSPEAFERTLHGDPFKEAGMRLTYRTVRVLMAAAEHPGASNRLIADVAEITDQGQISKLLGRLQRVGMVTNSGLGAGTGVANAWTLTPSGRQVTDSIRAHAKGGHSSSQVCSQGKGSTHPSTAAAAAPPTRTRSIT